MSEQPLFKVTIDNITIEVPAGTTILNAARKIGGEVAPPAMCYYSKLEGSGGKCRTCLVEVSKGSEKDPRPMPKLVASCRTTVMDGMEVKNITSEKVIDANGLMLDPVSQRVSFGNSILEMGPTEYRLLAFFMTHPERAYTRAQLLDQVWGGNVYIEDRTIDVHIRRLRKVLEPFGVDRFVQTVRGTGYRFSTRADLAAG